MLPCNELALRESGGRNDLPPLLVRSVMSPMLILKVFVLFRSTQVWLLCGCDETDIARYSCTNVDVLPVRSS